ncbi:hypothetical protein NEOLEDRAFT_1128881 [Neolentinus lepideus HHB14362 ss-1]|uniref:S-adenosyl-L-methionine-dependent methyltransferase n=1 Tax=Neolentinus lepideus HHB14362 ss-1 TaxID=1314782 RepID=A0A165UU33_9AGAM|nr:hypothetical protein NEOLEDRAFT_1128881 [Neolentinus lepideus HHB14362 ss-1]
MVVNKDVYVLPRNASEAERLQAQNDHYRRSFGGLLVHPSIPLHEYHSILDCCTGTGAWLRDARVAAHAGATFDACDLTLTQYDRDHSRADQVFVQDITQRFPEDRHGKYDLVHQRLLTAGIRRDQWPSAIANVAETLKSGGKLSITELNLELVRGSGDTEKSEHLEWKNELTRTWWKKSGLVHNCADHIPAFMQEAGLIDVEAIRLRVPYGATCLLVGMSESQVETSIRLYGGVSPALKQRWVESGVGSAEEYDAKQQAHEEFLRTEGMWMDVSMVVGIKP